MIQAILTYLLIGVFILVVFQKTFDKEIDKETDSDRVRLIVYVIFILFWFPLILQSILNMFRPNKE